MDVPTRTFVIMWYEREGPKKRQWYIRGTNAHGKFYGETRLFDSVGGIQGNITGQLSDPDASEVCDLIERIRSRSDKALMSDGSEYIGVLADGPPSHAAASEEAIILRAHKNALSLPSEADFARITVIIRNHIQKNRIDPLGDQAGTQGSS